MDTTAERRGTALQLRRLKPDSLNLSVNTVVGSGTILGRRRGYGTSSFLVGNSLFSLEKTLSSISVLCQEEE